MTKSGTSIIRLGNARKRVKGYWTKEREAKWKAISESARVRWTGCYNCPKDCHQAIQYRTASLFQKCYSKLTYAMAPIKSSILIMTFLASLRSTGWMVLNAASSRLRR